MVARLLVLMLTFGMMVVSGAVSYGQDYPTKPIHIITIGVGGGADFAARLIGPAISESLGQQVIVENRAGVMPMEIVAKAPPDGYTLLLHGSAIWLTPLFRETVSYDPVKDFSPISLTGTSPLLLLVHPKLPVKSVKDLIDFAKANPGKLNYAMSGFGGAGHLAAELFNHMAGIKMVPVAYKGWAAALTDMLSGEVQVSFNSLATMKPHVKSGRLRALGVTSIQPFALASELPTIAASGVPGYESGSQIGVFAPAKTPVSIINRLNQEIVRALNKPDVKNKFLGGGVEIVGSSPEELAAVVKSDIAKYSQVFKNAGQKPK